MAKEGQNKVSQKGNAVTGDMAGRDIYKITLNFIGGSPTYDALIKVIHEITGKDQDSVRCLIPNTGDQYGIIDLQRAIEIVSLSESSLFGIESGIIKRDLYESLLLRDSNINLHNEYISNLIGVAAISIKQGEFGKAHEHFKEALLKISATDESYPLLYKEFLLTGFIHFSRTNDMSGLKTLLAMKRSTTTKEDPYTEYLIANIFQEVCTRSVNLESLKSAAKKFELYYNKTTSIAKPSMANSLGLVFRRLGERTDVDTLDKAIHFFDEGLGLNVNDSIIEVELKDQKAIALIRKFEFTQEEKFLDEAENLLVECLQALTTIKDPRYFMLNPRVLNNLGNVFKQRVLNLEDFKSAAKAIAYYEEAGTVWSEEKSPYEWGLIKKNIGETNYALGKVIADPRLMTVAIENCLASVKHRDLINSPYQWAKSVEIIFMAVVWLIKSKSTSELPEGYQSDIKNLSQITLANKNNWTEINFPNFVYNARIVFRYFQIH